MPHRDTLSFALPLETKAKITLHEPQRAAGILPAEKARLCRRDVGSTLPGGTYFAKVHGPNACAKRMEASHEPQRAAGILPAEDAWLCRRDVGSTLLGRTSRFTMVYGTDARPILEVEALPERRLPNKSLCFTGFFINLDL